MCLGRLDSRHRDPSRCWSHWAFIINNSIFDAGETAFGVNVQHALREASEALDWADWRAYWDHVRALIAPLPRILQHGDLAMTNIAIADGEVVFFDWEDFGLVDVIGFDLAVVLFSLNDFDTARLRARLAAPTAEAALVRRGCARLNLSTNLFLELFPLYLSLFVKVKRSWGYHHAVSGRAIAALRDWLSAGPAHIAAG
jgi:aminoglycoside phosphotransferase (APT) family kinase protein